MTAIDTVSLPTGRSENRAWKKMKRKRSAVAGLVIVAFFTLLAIAAPVLPIPDPVATSWSAIRKAPSAAHWLGTDDLGRDILSRMIWGAQASLMAGVISVAISVVIGVPFGLAAGYFGGWVDMVISRVTEALLAMPFLIMAIALAAFLGPSLTNAMVAIGLSAMPVFVRLTRGQVLAVKTEDYVEGALDRAWAFPHHVAVYPSQYSCADHRAGDADDRDRHHRRGEPFLPRPWPAAAGTFLGFDAERRQEFSQPGAMDGDVAGDRHLPRRHRLQSSRRWPSRCT